MWEIVRTPRDLRKEARGGEGGNTSGRGDEEL